MSAPRLFTTICTDCGYPIDSAFKVLDLADPKTIYEIDYTHRGRTRTFDLRTVALDTGATLPGYPEWIGEVHRLAAEDDDRWTNYEPCPHCALPLHYWHEHALRRLHVSHVVADRRYAEHLEIDTQVIRWWRGTHLWPDTPERMLALVADLAHRRAGHDPYAPAEEAAHATGTAAP